MFTVMTGAKQYSSKRIDERTGGIREVAGFGADL